MPTSATAKMIVAMMPKKALVDRERGMASLRNLEPFVEERDGCSAVHQASRNPHDEAGEALVGDGIEADAGDAHRRVIRVPGTRREAHQRAERPADQRGREKAGSGYAI